jgi:hypothetical protein
MVAEIIDAAEIIDGPDAAVKSPAAAHRLAKIAGSRPGTTCLHWNGHDRVS